MPTRMAFCSACDRLVPVAMKPEAVRRGSTAVVDPADLVCLDYGVRCTGALCPLFSTPADAGEDPPRVPAGNPLRAARPIIP